ncbi:MAG: hypothetical protein ABWY35_03010 [Pseudorhodoplanes sp.]
MRLAVAAVLTLICVPAMAQSSPAIQATCERHMAPPYAKQGAVLDCGCVARFLTDRYGAADAAAIVRFFGAGASGSEKEIEAAIKEIGGDRIRAILNMVGRFQDLGRDIDQACPEVKKP